MSKLDAVPNTWFILVFVNYLMLNALPSFDILNIYQPLLSILT